MRRVLFAAAALSAVAARVGMNELDVIGVLGPPSPVRAENAARVLLYAMELGANAFLSGSVTLRERKVIEMQRPQLR